MDQDLNAALDPVCLLLMVCMWHRFGSMAAKECECKVDKEPNPHLDYNIMSIVFSLLSATLSKFTIVYRFEMKVGVQFQ